MKIKKFKREPLVYTTIIIIAILVTLCNYIHVSKGGFLSIDVAVWTNISKAIGEGRIIYRDIFDHKGPILYLLYFIGYMIVGQFGLILLDFVLNLITVYMIYSISELIIKDKWKIFSVILLCMFFMIRVGNENPCTESIALPFTLIALYHMIKFLMDSSSFKRKETIITSVCFAVVLLLRPNLTILWVLFYVVVLIKLIKVKKLMELLKIVLYSALGVCIIFIPIIIYFAANNAFGDFINCYIVFNLKYLGSEGNSIVDVLMYFVTETCFVLFLIAALNIVIFIIRKRINKQEQKLAGFNTLYFIMSLLLVIMPQRSYSHYLISLIPTFIIPLVIICKYIESKKVRNFIACVVGIIFIAGFFVIQIDKKERYKNFEKYYQYNLKIICKMTEKDDNVLVLGNKTYVYLITDRRYTGKYFFQTPVAYQSKEIADEIIEDIVNNSPDYIFQTMPFSLTKQKYYFDNRLRNYLEENYTEVNSYLYKRNENKEDSNET